MRIVSLILFALVLGAPFALRREMLGTAKKQDAPGSAIDRLVIITPHNQDIRNEFSRAFSHWHRAHYGGAVELDFRVPGGTTDMQRQILATYAAYRDAHGTAPDDVSLAWGGGDYVYGQLAKAQVLEPIQLDGALGGEFANAFPSPSLASVRLYDSTVAQGRATPLWIGVCLSSFGICYNPDVYRALNMREPSAEHGWEDLTDPRLAGLLALADPEHSGSSAVAFQMVIQHRMALAEKELLQHDAEVAQLKPAERTQHPRYKAAIAAGWKAGMSELLRIAANARYFSDSSTLVPMDVAQGQAAAGMAIDFYARVTAESAGPSRIGFFAPMDATAITPDPVGILSGASGHKLELARHFIEFLLSTEGQRLWIVRAGAPGGPAERSLRRMPIRRDLYADQTGWTDAVNPFATARDFNQRGEWMALFNDTRPIWVAAWIDSRDALIDSYRRVLADPDAAHRQRLLDELADLPVSMADVQALQKRRIEHEKPGGDIDLWRARQRLDWAARFRAHYQAVAGKAR